MLLVAAIAGVCMTALVVIALPNWGGQSTVATQTPSGEGQQSTIGGLGQSGGLGDGQGNGLSNGQNGISQSGNGRSASDANVALTTTPNSLTLEPINSSPQAGDNTTTTQPTTSQQPTTTTQQPTTTTTQPTTTTSTLPPSVDTLPPRVVEIEIDYNSSDEPKPGNPDPYGDPYGDGGDASSSDYPDGDSTIGGASSSQTYSETYSWYDGESERKVRAIFNATDRGKSGSQQPAIVGAGISDDGDAKEDTVLRFIDETTGAEMWLHGGVIIKFISEWGDAEIDAFMAAHGIDESRISTLPLTNTFLISTPPGLAAVELTQQLAGLEGVDLITPDWAMPIVGQ